MLSEPEVHKLLYELCVQLGFCLPPEESRRLKDEPPKDVPSFTDAVFLAEGLDQSNASRHLYRQVRDMVTAAFNRSEFNGV